MISFRTVTAFVMVACLSFFVVSPTYAQERASNDLPDAPSFYLDGSRASFIRLATPSVTKPAEGKLEHAAYRVSQGLVLAGFEQDTQSTVRFLEHPHYIQFSEPCLVSALGKVRGTCSAIRSEEDMGWAFREDGWSVHVLKLNPYSILSNTVVNLALDGGFLYGTNLLHKKGGKKMKALAIGLNVMRAGTRFYAAYQNTQTMHHWEHYVPSGATNVAWSYTP